MKMEYVSEILRGWPSDGALERDELINSPTVISNGTLVQMQPSGTVDVSGVANTRKAGIVIRGNGDSASGKNASGYFMSPQPTTSITAISTWVAPGFLTITTATVHGLHVGDFVAVAGVTTTAVNNNYVVESITDTLNFVVLLQNTPGAITVGSATVQVLRSVSTNGKALVLWANYIVRTTNYNTGVTYVPGSPVTASTGKFSLANGVASAALVPTAFTFSASTYLPNTVQVTFGAAHGLLTGQQVTIAGVTPAGYNGVYTITVTSTTTFTYFLAGASPGAVTVFGTATSSVDPEIGHVLKIQGTTATETAHLTIVVY
jgi:hypothetical protein